MKKNITLAKKFVQLVRISTFTSLWLIAICLLFSIVYLPLGHLQEVFASPFQKTLVDEENDYLKAIIISALATSLLLSTIIFILSKNSLIPNLFSRKKGNFIDEGEEAEKLTTAFYKMAKAIEGRDKDLKNKKETAEAANQEKSDFLLNISHELRTPMHAILNFAEIGKKKVTQNSMDKLSFYFTRIEESGERLLDLINGILDLTKLESGSVDFNFKKGDILKHVETSVNHLSSLLETKKIQLDIKKKTENLQTTFDSAQIINVIVNLLSNAIKFTPEGKKISILIDRKKITIEGQKEEKALHVSVINEGPKIPENELEVIFNKFIQSTNTGPGIGGSGIGLAICREIIQHHGGKISAKNEQNGTNFTFYIPENYNEPKPKKEIDAK